MLGLPVPSKRTATGEISTDAEVMLELAEFHPVPAIISRIAKSKKIKNTYIDKVLLHQDRDGRLRTGFNLTTTTSGRLSSSGTLNMQQLPKKSSVKGCIRARDGYAIISMDLSAAETYIAAVLSKDRKMQDMIKAGGDLHSTIAKDVFNLDCAVEDVKDIYPSARSRAKAVTFGVLYGAGKATVADSADISEAEAEEVIKKYFESFPVLAKWIKTTKATIAKNGCIYTHFGRKRRLLNVFSDSHGIAAHDIRSGLNAVIQSTASDVNLFAATELNAWLKANKMKTKIFAVVHDSVVTEVYIPEQEAYLEKLKQVIRADRGCSIKNCPIGIDIEIGKTYAFDKEEN